MKQKLDQYYTPRDEAEKCVEFFLEKVGRNFTFTEPSAGTGVFVEALISRGFSPSCYDLEPKHPLVKGANWFDVKECNEVVIGNPPFGKGGSMAIHFMNHAVEIGAKYIAFINPICVGHKLFTWDRINPYLEMIWEMPFSDNVHFTLDDGSPYRDTEKNPVRCAFQIWKVMEKPRTDPEKVFECGDFIDLQISCTKEVDVEGKQRELKVQDIDADIVFYSHTNRKKRAVPFKPDTFKANICRFLKVKEGHSVEDVIEKLNGTDFSMFTKYATIAHNPSLSPSEIITCYKNQHGV